MIHITHEQVEKYQSIYLQEHGIAIDLANARTELMSLVCLLASVHQHMEQHNWPDVNDIYFS
jgi:hypothetical protein